MCKAESLLKRTFTSILEIDMNFEVRNFDDFALQYSNAINGETNHET